MSDMEDDHDHDPEGAKGGEGGEGGTTLPAGAIAAIEGGGGLPSVLQPLPDFYEFIDQLMEFRDIDDDDDGEPPARVNEAQREAGASASFATRGYQC